MTKKRKMNKAQQEHLYTRTRHMYGMPEHGAAVDESTMRLSKANLASRSLILQTIMEAKADREIQSPAPKS